MEFLMALGVVFIGIFAWIYYYGDEVPSDEEYFDRIRRHSYKDDDDSDDDSSDDSGGDSSDDSGGDGDSDDDSSDNSGNDDD